MKTTDHAEIFKIALIVVCAFALLLFVDPGFQESPYNEF